MKRRRLPPLHALEAFEIAAEALSFQKAAQALHLTPSAVSHQIKTLEDHLGLPLFRRLNRALQLTEGGQAYLKVVRNSLGQLRDGGLEASQRYAQRGSLKISTGPFLTSEIIVPALPSFQKNHPEIDLHIETSMRTVDLRREDFDIALRFGEGRWPGVTAERLLGVEALPVCTPALARKLRRRSPDQLQDVVFIHSSPMPDAWALWAQAAGVKLGKPKNDLWLDSYFAILRAAQQGLGIALGMLPVVKPWLRTKRLATPWPKLKVRIPQGYYLVYRPSEGERREIQAFRTWLRQLLASDPHLR